MLMNDAETGTAHTHYSSHALAQIHEHMNPTDQSTSWQHKHTHAHAERQMHIQNDKKKVPQSEITAISVAW